MLQHGPNYNGSISNGYNTPKQAVDDGAVVLAYGNFLDKVVGFVVVALALWVIVLYILIQNLEGFVLTPLVQQRTVELPPVLIISITFRG